MTGPSRHLFHFVPFLGRYEKENERAKYIREHNIKIWRRCLR